MRRVRIKDDALEQRIFFQRTLVAAALLALLTLALAGRAFWLQVVQHARYDEMATNNRVRTIPLRAPRGVLFDRNGRPLVINEPTQSISIVRERSRESTRGFRRSCPAVRDKGHRPRGAS